MKNLGFALVLAGVVGACGSDDALFQGGTGSSSGTTTGGGVCAPGQQINCGCPGGAEGIQICRDDGTGYESCQCSSGSTGSTGPGGSGPGGGTATSGSTATSSSANAGGGGNGAGGGPACNEGDVIDCYSGPPGTENIGICHGGTQTCDGQGNFGPCFGDQTPLPDLCGTVDDEDCNGSDMPCEDPVQWSKHVGTNPPQSVVEKVVYDAAGNLIVMSGFAYGADFGDGVVVAGAVIAKLDPDGNAIWAKGYQPANGTDIAVDGAGNVLFVGVMTGDVDFGGGVVPLQNMPGLDAFVLKLGPDGTFAWVKNIGTPATFPTWATAVAASAAGDVIVGGDFSGTIDLGGGPRVRQGQQADQFVARFSAAGAYVWDRIGVTEVGVGPTAIRVDPQGDVVATGWAPAIDWGTGPAQAGGGIDNYVAKFDAATGQPIFVKAFGDGGSQSELRSTVDASGNILVAGQMPPGTSIDFGGGALAAGGAATAFVAKLDSNGSHVWSKSFGNGLDQDAHSVAVDAQGSVYLAGGFSGSVSFGGAPIVSAGSTDVFVVKLNPAGTLVFNRRYGDAEQQLGLGVAADAVGAPAVVGFFHGTIDFGQGPLVALANDGFIARLAP